MDGTRPEDAFYADSPEALRSWFAEHAADAPLLWLGYWKKHTGRPSLTWSLAVDEALCVGWIDGVVRRIDEDRYVQRFTPRKAKSTWSAVNVAKVAALEAAGRMTDAGRAAFAAREDERTGIYAFEQGDIALSPEQEAALQAVPGAWEFWQAQPASYVKTATWSVLSAKRADTRARRLALLVECCAAGELLPQLRR